LAQKNLGKNRKNFDPVIILDYAIAKDVRKKRYSNSNLAEIVLRVGKV